MEDQSLSRGRKIGIVGSRRRNSPVDLLAVREKLLEIHHDGDEIVSGGCPKGADSFAETLARQYGIPIKIYHANRSKGKWAGFARNTNIAEDADILIACVAEDRKGGTEDTILKFLKLGKNELHLI